MSPDETEVEMDYEYVVATDGVFLSIEEDPYANDGVWVG